MRSALVGLVAALVLVAPAAGGAAQGENGRILFSSYREGAAELFSVDADGSGLRRLTHSLPYAEQVAWAPRGGRIAISEDSGGSDLWTMRTDGSDTRRLTHPSDLCDSNPEWAPDGTRLAYVSQCDRPHPHAIAVIGADGFRPHVILPLNPSNRVEAMAWSPDGRTIAIDDLRCGILLFRPDGSGLRRILCGLQPEGVAFSPDGRRIVVDVPGAGVKDQYRDAYLYVAGVDGRDGQRIGPPLLGVRSLEWSRSGSIAFASRGLAPGARGHRHVGIFSMRADGSRFHRVVRVKGPQPVSISGVSLDWSPDGRSLVYAHSEVNSADGRIRIVRLDGTHARSLPPPAFATEPSWTADGQSIVYVYKNWISLPQLRIANARGGSVRVLVHAAPPDVLAPRLAPGGLLAYADDSEESVLVRRLPNGSPLVLASNAGAPAWSFDGTRIAYVEFDQSAPSFPAGTIWTSRPDGTDERRLTADGIASYPAWSTDGRRIAYAWSKDLDAAPDIWVMDADGTDPHRVAVNGTKPSWAADGGSIVLLRDDDLVTLDLATGEERTVVRKGSLASGPSWQPVPR
jgi:Tol biopolymer transport system component